MSYRFLCLSLTICFACIGAWANAGSLNKVYKKVNPSVVDIFPFTCNSTTTEKQDDIFFEGSLGSGFVISGDGLIITSAHLVQHVDEVVVKFLDGATVYASVIDSVTQADVALLRLKSVPEGLVAAELGDSDKIDVGDEIFVLGAPYGMDHTLTAGHLSGRRKSKDFSDFIYPIEFLQTDAAINKGNSGSPMFSLDGKVVGVVSYIATQSGGSEGLGFATSINTAKELLFGEKTFWSGLDFALISDELAKVVNLPQEAGLVIHRVTKNSMAYSTGLRADCIPVILGGEELLIGGDIVLEAQGITVTKDMKSLQRIRDAIKKLPAGANIKIKILRKGKITLLSSPKK